jgi:hypothetical protein
VTSSTSLSSNQVAGTSSATKPGVCCFEALLAVDDSPHGVAVTAAAVGLDPVEGHPVIDGDGWDGDALEPAADDPTAGHASRRTASGMGAVSSWPLWIIRTS